MFEEDDEEDEDDDEEEEAEKSVETEKSDSEEEQEIESDEDEEIFEIDIDTIRAGSFELLRQIAGFVVQAFVESQLFPDITTLVFAASDANHTQTFDPRYLSDN